MKQLVIFDLDGTLLNTIGDLAASCDHILKSHDLPTHSYEEYSSFVGNGVMRLVERAIPEKMRSESFVAKLRAEFVAYYSENISANTKIYNGILSLLFALEERNIAVAVASNKFHFGTSKLIRKFFPKTHFVAVIGQRPNVPLKPHPQIIYDVLNLGGFKPEDTLYVGDSGIDILTAAAAKIDSVGVTWGFRDRQELVEAGAKNIADTPLEILKFL
ncbi:MAG: HAD hydrolase-like protein [Rikenellaceae bacterium]